MVPPRDVPRIREFIRPFCIADPSGSGEIPEYTVTTLQLDTVSSDLVLAKEREAFDRFKLRIRTTGRTRTLPIRSFSRSSGSRAASSSRAGRK